MSAENSHLFVEGLYEAARAICAYCRRSGPPEANEHGVSVHRVFSSRGLANDHQCLAQPIYDRAGEEEKAVDGQSPENS